MSTDAEGDAEELPPDVVAGQAIYNRATLAVYDVGVLSLSCRLLWRCPKAAMLAAYNRNVGSDHLELGVGTAYFLDCCRFPEPRPRVVTLVDLNPTVLKTAAAVSDYSRPTQHHLPRTPSRQMPRVSR